MYRTVVERDLESGYGIHHDSWLMTFGIHDCIRAVEDYPPGTSGPWLSPDFVDLQVNGFDGHDVNAVNPTPATIAVVTT